MAKMSKSDLQAMDAAANALMRRAEKEGMLGDILNHVLTPEQRDEMLASDARFSARMRANGVQGY